MAPIPLGILCPGYESIQLLQKLSTQLSKQEADEIAEAVGDLPLALHLAGSYLNLFADVMSAADYLRELQAIPIIDALGEQATEIKGERVSPTDHIWHVGRTYKVSYDQLLDGPEEADLPEHENRKWVARRLLARAAVLAPGTPIPFDLLMATFEKEQLDDVEDEESAEKEPSPSKRLLQRGKDLLIGLGLAENGTFKERPALMIHRLTGEFVSARG